MQGDEEWEVAGEGAGVVGLAVAVQGERGAAGQGERCAVGRDDGDVPGVVGAGLFLDEQRILRRAVGGADGAGNGPLHVQGEGGGLAGIGGAGGGEGIAAVDGVGGGAAWDEGAHEVVVAPVAAGGEVDVVPGVGNDGVVVGEGKVVGGGAVGAKGDDILGMLAHVAVDVGGADVGIHQEE